ncbi:MAG: hypothetical protein HeimC3_33260 [Candidatus Heimdallarchaeota archaeon LC_3]|nr:MAG: hypothetical protein HeimC3_33260 [Candidatus Heimdallarchaeota archaeon LC_3]
MLLEKHCQQKGTIIINDIIANITDSTVNPEAGGDVVDEDILVFGSVVVMVVLIGFVELVTLIFVGSNTNITNATIGALSAVIPLVPEFYIDNFLRT